jgi:hypothetical protein
MRRHPCYVGAFNFLAGEIKSGKRNKERENEGPASYRRVVE